MDKLTPAIVEEFESITRFPLSSFLIRFDSFLKKDYPNVLNYYAGNISALNNTSFNNLSSLLEDTQQLFQSFSLNRDIFSNYKWWLLVDEFENIESTLLTIDNSSKWLRSTISKGNFNPNPEVEIPFKQNQTLESISRDVLGSQDWNNTWSNLAIKNDLREEDYTSEGGFLIKANFDFVLNNFKINAIVDNPVGEKVLGVDIAQKIEFDTTENDLVVLSPKETFFQNVTILLNLRKGDNPEFPDQGINPRLVVGSNVNSITYPVLFRQLNSLFRGDDTIKAFTIVKINRVQDAVSLDFQVQSRLGDVQNISLSA